MNIIPQKLPGVVLIEPKVFGDSRGFFMETFQSKRYHEDAGIDLEFVQDNYSRSSKGVLRGMHFQKTQPQGKLVRCVRGEIFDVVVDINPESPTYGEWVGEVLDEDSHRQLYIPPGYAHGFQVLSDIADMEYKCTDYYRPDDEGCLIWNDPDVGIEWPGEVGDLSEKDAKGLTLKELAGLK